ncbi:hypothetical protein F5X68DRAFT_32914 [Plectosphaerella plurivora]|uniref:Uncharacterized protein n=1 Tax=Plectosphaerella plurivora TaxID=936078 RepID=A0A9P8V7U8_9PEZI|nr:hypothetical protein F5X68DRAFT_32914 [Plectosphaerella plurivora]
MVHSVQMSTKPMQLGLSHDRSTRFHGSIGCRAISIPAGVVPRRGWPAGPAQRVESSPLPPAMFPNSHCGAPGERAGRVPFRQRADSRTPQVSHGGPGSCRPLTYQNITGMVTTSLELAENQGGRRRPRGPLYQDDDDWPPRACSATRLRPAVGASVSREEQRNSSGALVDPGFLLSAAPPFCPGRMCRPTPGHVRSPSHRSAWAERSAPAHPAHGLLVLAAALWTERCLHIVEEGGHLANVTRHGRLVGKITSHPKSHAMRRDARGLAAANGSGHHDQIPGRH